MLLTSYLSEWMIDLNDVGPMGGVPEHFAILARDLVGPADALLVPVRPEDPIVEDGQREDVRHVRNQPVSVLPVEVREAGGQNGTDDTTPIGESGGGEEGERKAILTRCNPDGRRPSRACC